MLERLIEGSARNRALVILVTLIVCAAGFRAMLITPVDAIPDLSDVQVIIKTDFAGQGPQIVEEQVTYPLSTAMLAVPYASTVRGYSMFGTSFVYIIFEDGTDMYWARSRVLEYLNQVASALPAGVQPSLGPDATGVGWVYQYSLTDTTGTLDLSQLRSIQDFYLKYELQSLPGVAEIATVGGFQKQYQVVVDPQKLAAYGIPISHVKMRLAASNNDVGGRIVEMGEKEFIVRGKGYLRGLDDIRAVPLRSVQGSPVTIGDVARVQLGPELRRGIAEKNGEGEVVSGIVVMRYGENALAVIDRVKARIEELSAGLPDGVVLTAEYDRSILIENAIDTLRSKIIQELIVVALIVLIFLLHARSAFVAVITVPAGILISFLVMNQLGINANIMSLGGIAIAIGVMVDASLVMVENAHKHIERLGDGIDDRLRRQAIIAAAKEVGPSLFFSLLIVTISFLPVFTLEQVEGRMFRPMAFTKTFAMGAASLLAVTLVPALMMVFIRGKIRSERRNPVAQVFIRAYRPIIRVVLKNPVLVLIASGLILGLTLLPLQRMMFGKVVVPFEQIGSEFMPALDEGDLLYMPSTLPGLSPGKAREVIQITDRIIKSFPEVQSVLGKIGRADTATDPSPLSMIETIIILKPKDEWRPGMTTDRLILEMNDALQLPGLTNVWTMPIKNRTDMLATGIKTPIGIKLAGPDLSVLEEVGREIEGLMRDVEGTQSVYAERVMGGSFLDIDVLRAEAARYDLTTGDVQDVIRSAIGGMNVTTMVEGLERYPVNIRYPRELRDDMASLSSVLVPTMSGAAIPLGQLARLSTVDGPPMIKSENGKPNAWIYVDLVPGQDLGSYVQRAQKLVASQVTLPAGVSLRWSGQFEYMQRAAARLRFLIPLTIAIIALLLLVHFRNMRDTVVLLTTLPFAVVGAVWLMVLLDFNMSIAVAVGFIAVSGLAAETGIVILVYLNEAVKRYQTEGRLRNRADLRAALEEGAVMRVRPLIMTAMTTMIGLLPIMFGTGTGSEVMKRIATPMVGGLISAVLLTLIVIPTLYMVVYKMKSER